MLRKRRPLQHRPKTLDLKTFKAHIFRTESSSQAQLDFEDQMQSNLKFFTRQNSIANMASSLNCVY